MRKLLAAFAVGLVILASAGAYSDQTKDISRDATCTQDGSLGPYLFVQRGESGSCEIKIRHRGNSLTFDITLRNVRVLRADVEHLFVHETCWTFFPDCGPPGEGTHYRTWLQLQEATWWNIDSTHDLDLQLVHFPEPKVVYRDGLRVDDWDYEDDTFRTGFVLAGLHEYILAWNVAEEPPEPAPGGFPWWVLVLIAIIVLVLIVAARRRERR